MKTVIAAVRSSHPIDLTEIDISDHPDLEQQFGTEIPVVLRGNQVVARTRVSATQLLERLGNKKRVGSASHPLGKTQSDANGVLLGRHDKVPTPVSRPAPFVRIAAEGLLFALAHGGNSVVWYTQTNEVILDRRCPLVPQR